MASLSVSEKYRLYESSVQCHEADIDFMNEQFKELRNRKPLTLREDFGGTAALACDWVKQSPEHSACSVDLDPEPISYGKENHYSRLTKTEKERMEYIEGNVLSDYEMKSDIIVGFNFSYFIFKKRQQLLEYFKKVREGISDDGLFFVDIFGGEECMSPLEEETEHDGHDYFWDLDKFNAVTNEVLYYIHFRKHDDKIKYERVFTYDWRMWTIPEVREIMEEAGFSKTVVFWEGDDDDGEGDGNFYQTKLEENCESWVSYIVGLA